MAPITLLAALVILLVDEAYGEADGSSIPKIQAGLRVKFSMTAGRREIFKELRRHPKQFFELDPGKWKGK